MRRAALALTLAAALVAPPAASAQTGGLPPGQQPPPPDEPAEPPAGGFLPDRITILAVFKTIELDEASFVSGRFRHLDNPEAETEPYRDKRVVLEEAPFPFTVFTPIGSAITDREGYYSFKVDPSLNSRYRVSSADPAVASEDKLIRVRIAVGVKASASRVKRGRSVEFRGTATPAHDGSIVLIQRRDVDGGRYRTAGRTRLLDDGEGRSRFRKRVRVKEDGIYRVRVSGDDDHLPGNSRAVTVKTRR